MKIGYYFPRKREISKSYYDKSDNSLIEWDSDLGCDFILSLFNNKNLDLPLFDENHKFSFSSLEDFQEFISLVKSINTIENIEKKIISGWPDNIIPSLKKLEKLSVNNSVLKDQINELIESFSENLSKIQKELNLPLVQRAEKLANCSFDPIDFSMRYILRKMLKNFEKLEICAKLEIPVFGFKLCNSVYTNFEFNQLIGYDYEKENTFYSQYECLNQFYKVIRTDNRDDVLWIMLERSNLENILGSGNIKLVFRSNSIKKINYFTHDKSDILNSKNDYVFFYKFIEKENSLFLVASDKPVPASSINSESGKVTLGMMEVLDSDGKSLDVENIKRIQITKTLKRGNILQGFKIDYDFQWSNKKGDKIELYTLVIGYCGDICKSCCKAPCICDRIIEWEIGGRSDDVGGYIYNFPPLDYDEEYFNSSYSLKDNFGLNWGSYNDQLDMDQQGQEFWDSNY